MTERPSKDHYYLNIACEVSRRSTCLRRHFGAIIVKNDQIISTGYAGAPRGTVNCIDLGECPRQKAKIPRGERYELCRSVHAEQNAIIHASRQDMIDSTMYLAGLEAIDRSVVKGARPCLLCTRMIINAGISKVVVLEPRNNISVYNVDDFIKEEEVDLSKVNGYGRENKNA